MAWVTAFNAPLPWYGSDGSGNTGSSMRVVCPLSRGGSKVRIVLAGGDLHSVPYRGVSFGIQQINTDMVSDPVQASGAVTAPQSGEAVLDPVDFVTTAGQKLIVVGDMDPSNGFAPLKTTISGSLTHQKVSAQSRTLRTVSGYDVSNFHWVVRRIEVWQDESEPPTPPPAPDNGGVFLRAAKVVHPQPALPSSNLLGGTKPAIPALEGYSGASWSILQAAHADAQAALLANGGATILVTDSVGRYLDASQIPGGFIAAIGADTMAGGLNRLESLTALGNAHALGWMLGGNDAHFEHPLATMQDYFMRVLNWRTGRFIWIPTPRVLATPTKQARLNDFYAWAAGVIANTPNARTVAFPDWVSAADTLDGVHPVASGSNKITRGFTSALAALQ